jgi:hypothetical protein
MDTSHRDHTPDPSEPTTPAVRGRNGEDDTFEPLLFDRSEWEAQAGSDDAGLTPFRPKLTLVLPDDVDEPVASDTEVAEQPSADAVVLETLAQAASVTSFTEWADRESERVCAAVTADDPIDEDPVTLVDDADSAVPELANNEPADEDALLTAAPPLVLAEWSEAPGEIPPAAAPEPAILAAETGVTAADEPAVRQSYAEVAALVDTVAAPAVEPAILAAETGVTAADEPAVQHSYAEVAALADTVAAPAAEPALLAAQADDIAADEPAAQQTYAEVAALADTVAAPAVEPVPLAAIREPAAAPSAPIAPAATLFAAAPRAATAPPLRIGAGRRLEPRTGWKPGNPLAGLGDGPIGHFHWGHMWRVAGGTAACRVIIILVLRTVFA